jgi:hypothetical protein
MFIRISNTSKLRFLQSILNDLLQIYEQYSISQITERYRI